MTTTFGFGDAYDNDLIFRDSSMLKTLKVSSFSFGGLGFVV